MRYARSRIYDLGEPPRETEAEREARRFEAAKEAWQRHGLAVLDPAEIDNDWLRAAVRAEADRRFGRRTRGAG